MGRCYCSPSSVTNQYGRQHKRHCNQHKYHQWQYPSHESFEHESSFLSFHPVRHIESIERLRRLNEWAPPKGRSLQRTVCYVEKLLIGKRNHKAAHSAMAIRSFL